MARSGEEGEDVGRAEDDVVEEEDFVVSAALGLLGEEWLKREIAEFRKVGNAADLFAFCPARRKNPALSGRAVIVEGTCSYLIRMCAGVKRDGVPDLVLGQLLLKVAQDIFGIVKAAALIDRDIDIVCA